MALGVDLQRYIFIRARLNDWIQAAPEGKRRIEDLAQQLRGEQSFRSSELTDGMDGDSYWLDVVCKNSAS